jgi:hypothetical protein
MPQGYWEIGIRVRDAERMLLLTWRRSAFVKVIYQINHVANVNDTIAVGVSRLHRNWRVSAAIQEVDYEDHVSHGYLSIPVGIAAERFGDGQELINKDICEDLQQPTGPFDLD